MFESLLNKGIPSGYTPLDAFNKVPKIHLYPYESEYIVGGSFDQINNTLILINGTGGTINVTGFTGTNVIGGNGATITGGTLSPGEILFTDNSGGTFTVTGFTKYFISGSSPTGYVLVNGDRWYNTNNGVEYVWIDDGDSSQWVEPTSSGGGGGAGYVRIEDGGVPLSERTILNFVGLGVNVIDDPISGKTIVNIDGASVGDYLSLIGLTANTISGGTFYGDGSNLTNIDNIYNIDGTLTSNRIIDLNGNTLSLRRTSNINDILLNGLDISGNTLFEIRSSVTNPAEERFPNLFIGKNVASISTPNVRTNLVVGNTSMTGITSGVKNTVFGNNAFTRLIRGSFNTVIGDTVAAQFTGSTSGTSSDDNIFIGNGVALNQISGRNNVIIGTNAREFATSGDFNTFVGKTSGRNNNGSGNIFLGNEAGRNETGSNLLYIENSSSATPLIWGDFTNDLLRFNGKVGINVLNSTYQFDVNGTSRFSNTVQLDTVNSGITDTKILTLSSGNVVQYRNLSDFSGGTTVTITGGTNIEITGSYPNFGINFTGTTGTEIIGDYLSLSGGTVTGDVIFQSGITANIISGGTIYGDGGNLTNIVTSINTSFGLSGNSTNGNITLVNTLPDKTVTISGGTGIITGGTYPNFTITNSDPDKTVIITGGTNIQIVSDYPNFGIIYTGQTEFPYLPLSGGTVTGDVTFQSGITSNTLSVNQIGVSGDCVNDLYVSNIHSCSPLNINPLNEGDVIFGSSTSGSSITIRLSEGRSRIGIGTKSPTNQLHIAGSENPVRIEGLPSGETKNKIITINEDGVLASSTLPEFAATLPVSFKLNFNGQRDYEVFNGTGIQNFGLLDRGMFVAFDLDTALKLPHTATTTDYIYSFRVTTHEQFGGAANNVGVRTVLASSAGELPFNTIAPAVFLPQTSTNYALQYSDVVVAVPKIVLGQPTYYVKFEIIMERFAFGSTSVIGANLRFN